MTKQYYANWDFAPSWAKWHTVDMHGAMWWQKRPKWDGWHWGRTVNRDELLNEEIWLYDDRVIDDRAIACKTLEKRPAAEAGA